MIPKKEKNILKKRWLYFIAIAFIFIPLPFILILLEGVFNNNADKRYPLQAFQVGLIGSEVVYFRGCITKILL